MDPPRNDAFDRLNTLDRESAIALLLEACGSRRWAEAVCAGRPYGTIGELALATDAAFAVLDDADWLQAFAAHPRIGEPRPGDATGSREQAGATEADVATRAALVEGNRAYEARFGHVFLICASGLSGEAMLTALRARLDAEPAAELRTAAREQVAITRLRLERMLGAGDPWP